MNIDTYIILETVCDQVGPYGPIKIPYEEVYIYCTRGEVDVIINGTTLKVSAGEILNEGVIKGKSFEVAGTGKWRGFLRGAK